MTKFYDAQGKLIKETAPAPEAKLPTMDQHADSQHPVQRAPAAPATPAPAPTQPLLAILSKASAAMGKQPKK